VTCGSGVPGAEFIARFLQHVLPAGFKRICHLGRPPSTFWGLFTARSETYTAHACT
jgi:hypothetical protein